MEIDLIWLFLVLKMPQTFFPRMLLPNARVFLCTLHCLVNKLGFGAFTDDCDKVLLVLDTEQPELHLLLTQPCL